MFDNRPTRRTFLAAGAGSGVALAQAEGLQKIDMFVSGTGGYALYRIPGIVVSRKGTVLVYAEARKSDRGDWGQTDIVVRRGDGAARVIASVPGPHHKNPVALAQKLATEGEVTYNNPVAIAGKSGAIHFVFCVEYMRAFYMRSDDDGLTFTKPVEITGTFEGFRSAYPWKVIATGPGHGIQLRSGRLLIPIWMSTGTGGHAHRPSVASTIYSDDQGATWKRGDIAVPDTPEFVFPSETNAAELSDGRVMLNTRTESKAHRRLVVFSKDGATGWSAPKFVEELKEPICFAGLISVPRKRGWILFSNPDNLERRAGPAEPGRNRDRRNLTVQLSKDDGATWKAKRVIEPGWSGYSDLGVANDGTALCFYERGGLGDDHFRTAALTLARFRPEWVAAEK